MSSNATCFHEPSAEQSPPLIQDGKLVIQTHHIGWIVTGVFTLASMCISLWLVNRHLLSYTNKHEQRYIIRILFMVPIYSVVSFASYLFWNHSTPLLLIRDCYEATVLTSFFYLLLLYVSPDEDEQRERSTGLSEQIEVELERRGVPLWTSHNSENLPVTKPVTKEASTHRKRQSWWRRALSRFSGNGEDDFGEHEQLETPSRREIMGQNYESLPVVEEVYKSSKNSPNEPPANTKFGSRSQLAVSSSQSRISTDDAILSRMFTSMPVSEASGPSSQTHPSSGGYHVRLTAPAPALPSNEHRASVRLPILTRPDSSTQRIRGLKGDISPFGLDIHRQPLIGDGDEHLKKGPRSQIRNSRHHRETAHH